MFKYFSSYTKGKIVSRDQNKIYLSFLLLFVGHHPMPTIRSKDNEESHRSQHSRDHNFLLTVRLHGLRRIRQQRAGKPPHRVRVLQPLLAPRHRQRRDRRPPRRCLPSLLPARLRLCREEGCPGMARLDLHHKGAQAVPLPPLIQRQHVPTRMEIPLRLLHHRRGDAASFLQ